MNVRFLIKLPIRVEGTPKQHATLSVDLMLQPYLISESALLSAFVEESEYAKYGQKAREIAFNSSVRAWEWSKFKLKDYPEEYKIHYVRELALCFAMNAFAKYFFQNFNESLHRSKTYGEFTVTTTVKNNPAALKSLLDQSKQCIDDIKAEIEQAEDLVNGLGLDNLKGACNPSNAFSWRMWFHNNLPERSNQIYASEKFWYNGNMYKDGKYVSDSRVDHNRRTVRSPVYQY